MPGQFDELPIPYIEVNELENVDRVIATDLVPLVDQKGNLKLVNNGLFKGSSLYITNKVINQNTSKIAISDIRTNGGIILIGDIIMSTDSLTDFGYGQVISNNGIEVTIQYISNFLPIVKGLPVDGTNYTSGDLNNFNHNGVFQNILNSVLNIPDGNAGVLIVYQNETGIIAQNFYSLSGKIFTRTNIAGVWGEWGQWNFGDTGFYVSKQFDTSNGYALVNRNDATNIKNAWSVNSLLSGLKAPTTDGQIGVVGGLSSNIITIYVADASLAWIETTTQQGFDGLLLSEDADNTPKYLLGGVFKDLGASVDLSNYYTKQQIYNKDETIGSITETINVLGTDYMINHIPNMVECAQESYNALYDGGILDNAPYNNMFFVVDGESIPKEWIKVETILNSINNISNKTETYKIQSINFDTIKVFLKSRTTNTPNMSFEIPKILGYGGSIGIRNSQSNNEQSRSINATLDTNNILTLNYMYKFLNETFDIDILVY